MRLVRCEPLTQAAFAPFGTVVDPGRGAGEGANDGRARRFSRVADVVRAPGLAGDARLETTVYRIEPSALPLDVDYFERHPNSVQLFYPGATAGYLVCVCLADGRGAPDAGTARAFRGAARTGVAYGLGVWHFPLVALDGPAEFLMQMWSTDESDDCEVARLAEPLRIAV